VLYNLLQVGISTGPVNPLQNPIKNAIRLMKTLNHSSFIQNPFNGSQEPHITTTILELEIETIEVQLETRVNKV
jgi:hypothetical protein